MDIEKKICSDMWGKNKLVQRWVEFDHSLGGNGWEGI